MHLSTLTAQAALLSLLSSTVYASATPQRRASVCNGYSELCSRSYGNVSYVGAHDSYAVGSTNLAANQDYNVTQQLTDGIRMLQNQAQLASDGSIHLCHTSCLLYDAGPLTTYLQSVKTWMDSNPNEVVSILLVNINNLAASAFGADFQSAGLVPLSYVPPSTSLPASQWPTLGSMIDAGTRLVTFMDNGANDTNFPYLIDEFSNIWETAFDVTDPSFSCAVNRSDGNTAQQMYLINHFLDESTSILGSADVPAPAKDQLNTTNAASGFGSLGQQASDCIGLYGNAPNFMLVDFYEYGQGSVFDVAASLNGVSAPTNTIAPPIINATSSSSSSSSNGALTDFRGSSALTIAAVVAGVSLGAWSVL